MPPSKKNIIKNTRKQIGGKVFTDYKLFNTFRTHSTSNKNLKRYTGKLTDNNFFNAFYLAYVLHSDIMLSPDDIWIAITIGFSNYVNENSEKLRDLIVDFEGKKGIVIEDESM